MTNAKIVHKIIWNQQSPLKGATSVVFIKVVDKDDMGHIRYFMGVLPYSENITIDECMELIDTGIELFEGAMDIFWNKKDYEEHDLMEDGDHHIAVGTK
jgi:hypothetical protein